MTWSISANGTKDEASMAIVAMAGDPGAVDFTQFERAKDHVLCEIDGAPGPYVSVSASGHSTADGSYESIAVSSFDAPADIVPAGAE